jgi:hypothetical protein
MKQLSAQKEPDHLRASGLRVDPALAARRHRLLVAEDKLHNSALCALNCGEQVLILGGEGRLGQVTPRA